MVSDLGSILNLARGFILCTRDFLLSEAKDLLAIIKMHRTNKQTSIWNDVSLYTILRA